MTEINVLKRNGNLEKFDADKINQVVQWACEGLDVSASEILMKMKVQLFDGIKTEDLQKLVIKSAADLIEVWQADYQYVAARLLMYDIRKKAFWNYDPPCLKDHVHDIVNLGWYDKEIVEKYSDEELEELDKYIVHDRDYLLAYAGAEQWATKYLVQNRVTGEIYESPQIALMLIAMCLHQEEKEDRIQKVVDFYDEVSLQKLSLPTPIMSGVRTPTRQFSSCTLIESGDSEDRIFNAVTAVGKYAAKRAGIGLNLGAIRAQGAPIRGGEAKHAGLVGITKMFQETLGWVSQGGTRKGSMTVFFPVWHKDVRQLLVLKNNRGTEDNRARHIDYAFQFNKLMYERLIKNENITLFSPDVAQGKLYEYFFSDQQKFEELYTELEKTEKFKEVIPAIELFSSFAQERAQTGRIYLQNVDHCNTNSPFNVEKAPIRQSNLCVAPETQILTDKGYIPIAELEGEVVNVWNGEEFSETTVKKTGENQKLIKVVVSSGQEVECTPYHKFYVFNGYGKPYIEKRAHELVEGDKLCKYDLPVIEGDLELHKAYENGFYSGDGCCVKGRSRIYLYDKKKELEHLFNLQQRVEQPDQNRIYGYETNLKDKFFVPSHNYTIQSRLDWLAGWLDSDGSVYRNGTNEQLIGSSIEFNFLREVQLMLQTLGVDAKINLGMEEGFRKLPKNDGSGENGDFYCQIGYRLLINSVDTYKLLDMGLTLHRLKVTKRLPQRSAKQFSKVVKVVDEYRIDDTFCFNEPKRHMGMFNGILTGQCLEIALPTNPIDDIYEDEEAEIALCTLAAFNLGKLVNMSSAERMSSILKTSIVAVRSLDNLLDYQGYPVKAAEKNKLRRTLGIGVIDFAHYLAAKGLKYSDGSANNETHELFEQIQWALLYASCMLAKEKGACEKFIETTYFDGILPIDRYKKSVDNIHTTELKLDWEELRKLIKKYGLRNSTLSALMPSETSSQISNATNGIEPPRDLLSIKSSGDVTVRQVVPNVIDLFADYEKKWEMNSPRGYLELCAIMQKFVDQTISANTFYKPEIFEGGKFPIQTAIEDIVYAYSLGIKTLYYHETKDGNDQDEGCESGACKI